jgi:hypothetical protein
MVKPAKYLRKQAVKAEVAAGRINDPEISTEMLAMASAYRSQADILKRIRKPTGSTGPRFRALVNRFLYRALGRCASTPEMASFLLSYRRSGISVPGN